MSEKDKTLEKPNLKETTPIDPISARLDEIENNFKGTIDRQTEIIEQQNRTIEELKNRTDNSVAREDELILVDRQSAHTMRLPVVDGAPVISGKLERIIGVEGLEYVINVNTADGKSYKFPFGSDVGRINFADDKIKDIQSTSYENIKTMNFKLQDIDTNDLTGASKVVKGQIVGEGGVISEIDRSSGRPMATGRKIRTVVRSDIRYYTIEYAGKKHVISSEDLGNFRI